MKNLKFLYLKYDRPDFSDCQVGFSDLIFTVLYHAFLHSIQE
jgi:hypothetical protein